MRANVASDAGSGNRQHGLRAGTRRIVKVSSRACDKGMVTTTRPEPRSTSPDLFRGRPTTGRACATVWRRPASSIFRARRSVSIFRVRRSVSMPSVRWNRISKRLYYSEGPIGASSTTRRIATRHSASGDGATLVRRQTIQAHASGPDVAGRWRDTRRPPPPTQGDDKKCTQRKNTLASDQVSYLYKNVSSEGLCGISDCKTFLAGLAVRFFSVQPKWEQVHD